MDGLFGGAFGNSASFKLSQTLSMIFFSLSGVVGRGSFMGGRADIADGGFAEGPFLICSISDFRSSHCAGVDSISVGFVFFKITDVQAGDPISSNSGGLGLPSGGDLAPLGAAPGTATGAGVGSGAPGGIVDVQLPQ